jgi:hypothetical protein
MVQWKLNYPDALMAMHLRDVSSHQFSREANAPGKPLGSFNRFANRQATASIQQGDHNMRVLICALAAAGIIGFSMSSYAADENTVTAPNKPKAAGRAIDDGTVTTGKPKKFGREIDDGTVRADKPKKFGREIDNGTFGTERPKKYGRTIDDGSVKVSKKTKEHGRAIEADNTVKTKLDPNKPGRAVQEEKK